MLLLLVPNSNRLYLCLVARADDINEHREGELRSRRLHHEEHRLLEGAVTARHRMITNYFILHRQFVRMFSIYGDEVILSTSLSGSAFSSMKCRICMIGSAPTSTAFLPSRVFPFKRWGGRYPLISFPSSNKSATSMTASRSFIFMKGHIAHPPAVEHPSPAGTPGTTTISASPPTGVTASDATGKIISASTRPPVSFSARLSARIS
mmetsp:Transcript_21713/g.43580  ORF Transcript_21713/g.43580 Transcript_21713/m.43580 type:complete len:207 (-) Transcript_21713:411-1031(-)